MRILPEKRLRFFCGIESVLRVYTMAFTAILIVAVSIQLSAVEEAAGPSGADFKVVYLHNRSEADAIASSDDLIVAIRAQLALMKKIKLVRRSTSANGNSKLQNDARALATNTGADLIFWIKGTPMLTLHFFVPAQTANPFFARQLSMDSDESSNQFETIAIAVATAVESARDEMANAPGTPAEEEPKSQKSKDTRAAVSPQHRHTKMVEASAGYSGTLFAPKRLTHAASIELGISTSKKNSIFILLGPGVPWQFEDSHVVLSFRFWHTELGVSRSYTFRNLAFRPELSWQVALRRVTTTPNSRRAEDVQNSLSAIHSILPSLRVIWFFQKQAGLYIRAGMAFAINETWYQIRNSPNPSVDVISPYACKPFWRGGVLLKF